MKKKGKKRPQPAKDKRVEDCGRIASLSLAEVLPILPGYQFVMCD